jgi:hypothetical protein
MCSERSRRRPLNAADDAAVETLGPGFPMTKRRLSRNIV